MGPRGVAVASSEEEDEGAPEKKNNKIKKPSGKRRNDKQTPSNASSATACSMRHFDSSGYVWIVCFSSLQ